jgi:hypothetical protein
MISSITMGGSVVQFTTVTQQVFLPLLFINAGGCAKCDIDGDGDVIDTCTDPAPNDPSR